jgi:hypothetical protein
MNCLNAAERQQLANISEQRIKLRAELEAIERQEISLNNVQTAKWVSHMAWRRENPSRWATLNATLLAETEALVSKEGKTVATKVEAGEIVNGIVNKAREMYLDISQTIPNKATKYIFTLYWRPNWQTKRHQQYYHIAEIEYFRGVPRELTGKTFLEPDEIIVKQETIDVLTNEDALDAVVNIVIPPDINKQVQAIVLEAIKQANQFTFSTEAYNRCLDSWLAKQ